MGRGGKKFRGGGRRNVRDRDGGGGGSQPYRSYPAIVKENDSLQRLYDAVLPLDDAERTEFWAALRRELPNSFRFCGSKGHALAVKRLLETRYAPDIAKIERWDGEPVQAPQSVPWYPDQLAYSMNTPKKVVRKFPPFAAFQKFLVSETSVGNISRQELVSMIPPLLMDIRPGMKVLDLCAAPGSKAAQLLEMVHAGEEARLRKMPSSSGEHGTEGSSGTAEDKVDLAVDEADDGRATGLLVANDVDYKRSHMLVHQLKRLSSPNLLVTNHDATLYPSIKLPGYPDRPDKGRWLRFDRILADVPCSGDGTLRKNVNLWMDWIPGNALGLHQIQVRILVRALQMLKVGGRVAYSTCSMNPVENEAVIVSAIELCGGPGKVEIVDCSDRLPLLKRKPGMFQWQVMDKNSRLWSNWEEVENFALTSESGQIPGRLSRGMFPRSDENECASLPLDRCMRIYAHQQDTGGFFIGVLEKKGDIKTKSEAEQRVIQTQVENGTTHTVEAAAEVGEPLAEEKVRSEEEKAALGEPTDILPTAGVKRSLENEKVDDIPAAKKVRSEETVSDDKEIKAEAASSDSPSAVQDLDRHKRCLENEKVDDISAAKKVRSEEAVSDDKEIKAEAASSDSPSAVQGLDHQPAEGQPSGDQTSRPKANEHRIKGPGGFYEEPFKYIPTDHEVINSIRSFYKVSDRFPADRYMVRNATGEPARAIYYTSGLLRDILTENEGRGIKFVHGGVRMFMKQEAPSAEVCRWRVQSEGLPIIAGYVGPERVVTLTNKQTFHKLLREMFPKFGDGDWVNLGEIGERARDIGMGCCILSVEPDGSDTDFSERLVLPLWKSFQSLNLMLPKEDRSAMLLRLYDDTSPVINQSLKQTAMQQAAKREAVEAEMKGEVEKEAGASGLATGEVDAPEQGAAPAAGSVEEDTNGDKVANGASPEVANVDGGVKEEHGETGGGPA